MVQVTRAAGAPTFQPGDFSTLSQLIVCCHIFISGGHTVAILYTVVCAAICAQAADTLKYGAGCGVFFLNHFYLEKKVGGGGRGGGQILENCLHKCMPDRDKAIRQGKVEGT
jgi:hypothetical protein